MKRIVIIGAGGFAREVKFLLADINRVQPRFEFLGYIISDTGKISKFDSKDEILGDMTWFNSVESPVAVVIGIGSPQARLKVAQEVKTRMPEAVFPPLIHPNVIYDEKTCTFSEGVIVCASCVLTVNVRLKPFSMLNLCCTVGHEAVIGDGSVLNPTVNVSGGVELGEGVLVGTGAQILQYVKIGDHTTLGAGACATRDLPADVVAVGLPAKIIKSKGIRKNSQ